MSSSGLNLLFCHCDVIGRHPLDSASNLLSSFDDRHKTYLWWFFLVFWFFVCSVRRWWFWNVCWMNVFIYFVFWLFHPSEVFVCFAFSIQTFTFFSNIFSESKIWPSSLFEIDVPLKLVCFDHTFDLLFHIYLQWRWSTLMLPHVIKRPS